MKRPLSFLFLLPALTQAYAQASVSHEQMLQWSKEKIIQEAKRDSTQTEIDDALKDFPVTVEDQCGTVKLIFIKNTPQCGNVNCKYLTFKIIEPAHYQYLAEVDFAAERMLCYANNTHTYLVTSLEETNASSMLYLDKIADNKLVRISKLRIDLTQPEQKEFSENIWDAKMSESALLKGFKK